MTNVLDFRRYVGQAVWLLLFYCRASEAWESEWVRVAKGRPVTDAEAAYCLGVCQGTAARWRKKLERVDLVRTTSVPGGRVIWLRNLDRHVGAPEPPAAEQREPEASRPQKWIQ